jgi:hypothetical protein
VVSWFETRKALRVVALLFTFGPASIFMVEAKASRLPGCGNNVLKVSRSSRMNRAKADRPICSFPPSTFTPPAKGRPRKDR